MLTLSAFPSGTTQMPPPPVPPPFPLGWSPSNQLMVFPLTEAEDIGGKQNLPLSKPCGEKLFSRQLWVVMEHVS